MYISIRSSLLYCQLLFDVIIEMFSEIVSSPRTFTTMVLEHNTVTYYGTFAELTHKSCILVPRVIGSVPQGAVISLSMFVLRQ